jgi:hypothetical protein
LDRDENKATMKKKTDDDDDDEKKKRKNDEPTHHAAVAPEAARVQKAHARLPAIRKQPHLRVERVHAVPRVDAEHGQPELAPVGDGFWCCCGFFSLVVGLWVEE